MNEQPTHEEMNKAAARLSLRGLGNLFGGARLRSGGTLDFTGTGLRGVEVPKFRVRGDADPMRSWWGDQIAMDGGSPPVIRAANTAYGSDIHTQMIPGTGRPNLNTDFSYGAGPGFAESLADTTGTLATRFRARANHGGEPTILGRDFIPSNPASVRGPRNVPEPGQFSVGDQLRQHIQSTTATPTPTWWRRQRGNATVAAPKVQPAKRLASRLAKLLTRTTEVPAAGSGQRLSNVQPQDQLTAGAQRAADTLAGPRQGPVFGRPAQRTTGKPNPDAARSAAQPDAAPQKAPGADPQAVPGNTTPVTAPDGTPIPSEPGYASFWDSGRRAADAARIQKEVQRARATNDPTRIRDALTRLNVTLSNPGSLGAQGVNRNASEAFTKIRDAIRGLTGQSNPEDIHKVLEGLQGPLTQLRAGTGTDRLLRNTARALGAYQVGGAAIPAAQNLRTMFPGYYMNDVLPNMSFSDRLSALINPVKFTDRVADKVDSENRMPWWAAGSLGARGVDSLVRGHRRSQLQQRLTPQVASATMRQRLGYLTAPGAMNKALQDQLAKNLYNNLLFAAKPKTDTINTGE